MRKDRPLCCMIHPLPNGCCEAIDRCEEHHAPGCSTRMRRTIQRLNELIKDITHDT